MAGMLLSLIFSAVNQTDIDNDKKRHSLRQGHSKDMTKNKEQRQKDNNKDKKQKTRTKTKR